MIAPMRFILDQQRQAVTDLASTPPLRGFSMHCRCGACKTRAYKVLWLSDYVAEEVLMRGEM